MSECPIAKQVANHCVEDEVIECPKCFAPMVYSPLDPEIVQCTNNECFYIVDMQGE